MGCYRHALSEPTGEGTRANGIRGVIEFVESGRVGRSAYARRSRSRAAVPSMRSSVSKVPFSISARMARVRAILKLDFSDALANALAVGEISTVSLAELEERVGCGAILGDSMRNEGAAYTLPILLTSLMVPRPIASGGSQPNARARMRSRIRRTPQCHGHAAAHDAETRSPATSLWHSSLNRR